MIFEIESSGKTIEKAVENALFELKAAREDVDIKILEQGGLFKKARVFVSISEDVREKYERKNKLKEETLKEEQKEEKEALKEEKKEFKAELKEEKKQDKEEKKQEKEEAKEEKKLIKKEKTNLDAESFVKGLVEVTGLGEEVSLTKTEEEIRIEISGKNASDLIGYRGECLNAIQIIANTIQNENSNEKVRVVLDIENYKEKRAETLKALARRMAKKVQKTGKSVKLEPMNANDRRIIHTELQSVEGVTTISKGTEPNRFLIILPEKENKEE